MCYSYNPVYILFEYTQNNCKFTDIFGPCYDFYLCIGMIVINANNDNYSAVDARLMYS